VPELFSSGIDVQQIPKHQQFIASVSTSITAFVGRTQRGPVNEPVRLESFDDYQRIFGGLWGLSPLSFAVEQYFLQGGRVAIVVRVVNGGSGASLSLPAGEGFLSLRARNPGTHEVLRASVDHDGIDASDQHGFNLIVQRLLQPGSEHVLEQESYRRVSVSPDDDHFIGEVLADSQLVRLEGDLPECRPDRTPPATPDKHIGYQNAARDGDDGETLTDYDIIGSATRSTGLFALSRNDMFNLLCIPPLDRARDVGLVTWLAAVRYCKKRRAMLVVDPPKEWTTVDQALRGMKRMSFASEDAVMVFPRLTALGGMSSGRSFAPCGALAGLLARNDERRGVWSAPSRESIHFHARIRPTIQLDREDLIRLAAAGVNGIVAGRPGAPAWLGSARTMAAGDSSAPSWNYLATRRLSLMILESIDRGTRWTIFAGQDKDFWRKLKIQVEGYLEDLWKQGALVGSTPSEAFFVQCDSETNVYMDANMEGVNFVLGVALRRPGEFISFEVSQRRDGARIGRSNVNPNALYGR
jgi:phage tail sheath protein FI